MITVDVENVQYVVKIRVDILLHVSAIISSLNVSCCVAGSLPNFGSKTSRIIGAKTKNLPLGIETYRRQLY